MFIPGISSPSKHAVYPRKGGGAKGGGKSGSSSKGSSGRSGSSSSTGSKGSSSKGSSSSDGSTGSSVGSRGATVSTPGSTVGRTSAVSYGTGSTKVVTIPQGQLFAGRTSGGATRSVIYGSPQYGSGYPGSPGLGVTGRNFPFVFWPVVWGGGLGYGAAYLHTHEYGDPNNSSRPGGPMAQAAFISNSTNTTFHVVADNTTVAALIGSISTNCTFASNSSTSPSPFTGAATDPLPEQAIEYYRSSSIVLTLDGYNDTAALTGDANATAPPLPSNIDQTLLTCLNDTIGQAAPLFDGASGLPIPSVGLFGLVYVLWWSVSSML